MSNSGSTNRSANAARLTRLFEEARSPDKRRRDDAFEQLYKYVAGPMRGLIEGCVRRLPGGPFRVTEAVDDAVGALFLNWDRREVRNTEHFRALVVRCVYWKVCDQRRASRHLLQAITENVPAPAAEPAEHDALARFEEAVEALAAHEQRDAPGRPADESPTPLADVVKARHLLGVAAALEGAPPPAVGFKEVGELLKISTSAANKRYWQALQWLHANFPDVVPKLPEPKKSGRKKAEGGNGGAP